MAMRDLIPWRRERLPVRREEQDPFLAFRQEMDRMFDEFATGSMLAPFDKGWPAFEPRVDVVETDQEVKVTAELPGLDDIALTTNAVLLPRLAEDLADAGLKRITVSLDTLDEEVLDRMSGGKAKPEDVLNGIAAAEAAGFRNIKINAVVQRGVNDHTVLDLLDHFRGTPHLVRLIEYMDVGNSNHWNKDEVVSNAEWVESINQRWPIEPLGGRDPAETARRYRYRDGAGEIGFISSITQPFCGGCSRARVTADGILYTCLFANKGTNLMPLIRHGAGAEDLHQRIHDVWTQRDDRYSEERGLPGHDQRKVEMYRMGG